MFVVEIDRTKSAASRTGADVAAVSNTWETEEILSVWGKGVDATVERFCELVALVELVDVVLADSSCICAGADEDLQK